MRDSKTKAILTRLRKFLRRGDSPQFNYERILLVDKAPYLDAFIEGRPFVPFEIEVQTSSSCNLHCRWCIGTQLQRRKQVVRLANHIREDNVERIVDGILAMHICGLGITMVKFSGFLGDPMNNRPATLKAVQRLVGAGKRVGVFTNGTLMGPDTFATFSNVDYVHISLDAGPITYELLKGYPDAPYDGLFEKVIGNIKGLDEFRKKNGGKVQINVGYIITPGSHLEMHEATRIVKEAGANAIRFKCDIGGMYDLAKAGIADKVYQELDRVYADFHDPASFCVHIIHQREDVENKSYAAWKSKDGCFFQNFLAVIGSDANVYLCDHCSMPGAIPLGNAINTPLQEIWQSERRKYLTDNIPCVCEAGVCPPFANRANFFLREIVNLKQEYGIPSLKNAIQELRAIDFGRKTRQTLKKESCIHG